MARRGAPLSKRDGAEFLDGYLGVCGVPGRYVCGEPVHAGARRARAGGAGLFADAEAGGA